MAVSHRAAASSSGASQPTEQGGGASQPTEQGEASAVDLTEVWSRIRKWGRIPKHVANPETETQHEQNQLFKYLYHQKAKRIPEEVWNAMRDYGVSQPVDEREQFLDELRALGRMPKGKDCNVRDTQ